MRTGKIPSTRRTPKVFHSAYAPPRSFDWGPYRSLWPLIALLFLVVLLYVVSQLPAFKVKNIEVFGQTTPELLVAMQKLKGSSLLSGAISTGIQRVKNAQPNVESLDCRRGIPSTLKCTARLRQTALTWKSGPDYFAVDDKGYVFTKLTVPVAMTVEDRSNKKTSVGETVASAETVADFNQLSNLLNKNQLTVDRFFVQDTILQCGVVLTGSKDPALPFAAQSPLDVFFTFDRPLDGQVATLLQLLKDKHDAITNHVDLRAPVVAYYQ